MNKTYTIGEVFRLGLLKNHRGEAYRDKATCSRVISRLKTSKKKTAWGMATVISLEEIKRHNKAVMI